MTSLGLATQLAALSQPPHPTTVESNGNLVYLSDIKPQLTDWLWQHRLAAGTLAMISGESGSGKTWLALAIAAALTRGRAPFTGETVRPSTVLYLSTEHAAEQIIYPRFAQLEGDLARLVVLRAEAVSASTPSTGLRETANFPTALLENALQQTRPGLLILDPWHSLLAPPADPQQHPATRSLFKHLAGLAERHHCCILLLRHLQRPRSGRPARHADAAIDLSSALRTEFLAGTSPDAPAEPALLHIKSNLGPLTPPLAYKIDRHGNFIWSGPSNLTPEELLSARPTGAGLPKRKFAAQWLRQFLQEGSRTQGTIEIAAERDGVCISTLRRAKFDLGVSSVKDGRSGVWNWTLPPADDPHPAASGAR